MTGIPNDFAGYKAIIYDDAHEKTIAEATIVSFDREQYSAVVRTSKPMGEATRERLSILILCEDSVFECKGNVRKQTGGRQLEIALFQGRIKNDRAAVRYTLSAPATVENLMIGGRLIPLHTPVEVDVINLSAAGMLIGAQVPLLNIGTAFQLKLSVADRETVIHAQVVRINVIQADHIEYGCRF